MMRRMMAFAVALVAVPVSALTVQVSAFTAYGIPVGVAQCIVDKLGEGADLATAGEEDSEGELQSVLTQALAQGAAKVAKSARAQFFKTVSERAFQNPRNRRNFVSAANDCDAQYG